MHITSSRNAYHILRDQFDPHQEEFWVLALQSNSKLVGKRCLFRGTANFCPVHPRDIFRFALLSNATSLIISHNHPSQDLLPSVSDIKLTKQLVKAGKILQIPIVDHLILSKTGYVSFLDHRWEPFGKVHS